jgi:hypothetical protein
MKKIVFVALCVLSLFSMEIFASSNEVVKGEAEGSGFSKTLTIDFFNKYVGPSGSAYTRGYVYQPSVTVEHDSGLYFSVWGSGAFNNGKDKEGNEADYIIGWAGDVGSLSIDTGVGYYDFYKLCHGRNENAWALFVEASKEYEFQELGLTLTPTIRFEEDIPEPGSSYERNFYTTAGIEFRKELFKKVEVYFFPTAIYDNSVYGTDNCTLLSSKLGVDVSVFEDLLIKPTATYYLPLEQGDREEEFVFGVGLEYSF